MSRKGGFNVRFRKVSPVELELILKIFHLIDKRSNEYNLINKLLRTQWTGAPEYRCFIFNKVADGHGENLN